jgi:flagellar hook assembly protein FlgD
LLSADEETIENNSITVYRNFPNPFQKETTIKFVVSNGNRKINLDIFNIKGQKVRSLVNSTLNSGNYSILWNGLDDNGKRVSNGVYFYKVSSENFTSVKKMILMK